MLAAGGIALILLLGAAAVSPGLHDRLHDGTHAGETNHTCVVVLFASGVTSAVATIAVAAPAIAWRDRIVLPAAKLFLSPPRYLRQPERGPPVG